MTTRNRLLPLRLAAALGAAASVGCGDPTSPAQGEPFDPPAVYAAWWADIEDCSGLTARLADVRWRIVNGWELPHHDGHAAGLYDRRTHTITLAGAYRESAAVVQHEMLHAILWRVRGLSGHPPEYFDRQCPQARLY